MTYPISLNVTFDFSSGPSFDPPFQIGISQLGIGVMGAGGTENEVVNLTSQAIAVTTTRGRDLTQDKFNPGLATVRVLDINGDWNPQNTASPYFGLLQPLRKIIITADYNNQTYPIYAGYTLAYNYTYPQGEELGYIDISATDAFTLFNKSAVTTVTGAANGDTTGQRIEKILDTIGFPGGQRNLDVGDTLVQNDPGTLRTVLEALRQVEATELGAVYIGANGDVVFRERTDAIDTLTQTPTVFDQSTGINYKNLKFSFDDKLIFNVANFTRVGGSTQTTFDQPSIDTYFPHTITRNDLLYQSDAETLNAANAYIAGRKTTDIRIDAMTLDLTTPNYQAGIEAALGLDFFDPVEITNDQPGGSSITKNLQVFGIKHAITPSTWLTTITTGEPVLVGFIIGNAQYGIIGESVMTY
jgi:hypothetical protein